MAKTKTRQRRRAQQKSFVYRGSTTSPQTFIDNVVGIVNPFSEEAIGSKIHDASSAKTFPVCLRDYYSMQVNKNGSGYVQVNPTLNDSVKNVDYNNAYVDADGAISTSTVTSTSTNAPFYSSVTSNAVKYRIVSWGIRITSLQSALDAKGRLIIRELDDNQCKTSGDALTPTERTINLPITHDMDFIVVPSQNNDSYQMFVEPDVTYTTLTQNSDIEAPYKSIGITMIGASGSGADNTGKALITIERIYNIECQPVTGSLGSRICSNAAPHNHVMLEAVHNTRAALPLGDHSTSWWSKVKRFAGDALKGVGQFALNKLTGGVSNMLQDAIGPILATGRKRALFAPQRPLMLTNG